MYDITDLNREAEQQLEVHFEREGFEPAMFIFLGHKECHALRNSTETYDVDSMIYKDLNVVEVNRPTFMSFR